MPQSDSEEDDYMSDALIPKGTDVRPGLLSRNATKQYKNEIRMKQCNERSKTKPRQVLEHEKREEGLNKTISSENRGFALLQKMGYKPGMALGKKNDGRSEPVPIQIKSGRGGLGRENELKRKQDEASKMRLAMAHKRQRRNEMRGAEYRQSMRDRFTERKAEADLYKSQKVCEQLDSEQGLQEPSEKFFWPAAFLPKTKRDEEEEDEDAEEEEEEEDDGIHLDAAEKLEVLTAYLRNKYLYCVWCGTAYNDKEDLKSNCPGDTADDHT